MFQNLTMKQFALVGKPNSGKSSLFNLLTGLNQKTANYNGATVEKKLGNYLLFEVLDLPGIRSLKSVSLDEQISKNAILQYAENKQPIVFVLSATQLTDNLLFFTEVADLQIPCLVVINFKDELERNKISINTDRLADLLGCPVVLMNSKSADGLAQLKQTIEQKGFSTPNAFCRNLYDAFEEDIITNSYAQKLTNNLINTEQASNIDLLKRQKIVASIVRNISPNINRPNVLLEKSKRWDKILLHPVFGLLLFLLTLLVVFQAVFYFAAIPMDWIDAGFAKLTELANQYIGIPWLADLVSNGILPGLGGVLIFIPQIAILFFLLGVLEHSGYLSRISFISNRFLSVFGLSGQSIIPLMSSWACAIPAIMSARTIDNPKERMAIIFASPLMTCSARLPVYTILIAIMYPATESGFFNAQGLLLLGLYLIGVVATLLVAWLAGRRSKLPDAQFWSLELPVYRMPNWRNVWYNMYYKTKAFVVDAGKVIFVVSMVLWLISSFSPKSADFIENAYQTQLNENDNLSKDAVALEYSYAGYLGKMIEPVIAPLGYDWKIGIAIIASFAAREVFVGALSTIYSIGGDEDETLIKARLQNEINTKTNEPRYNFATCLSLLLFYAFALQCMSTVAIVKKETGSWTITTVQFLVMLVMAYVAAMLAYWLF